MTERPTDPSTDLPPLDTSKICIEINAVEPPDFTLDFEVPVDILSEASQRIQDGGLEYNEKQMGDLIVQICLDEGMQRLDRDSAWGIRLLANSFSTFSIDEPFSFSAIVDVLPEEEFSIESIPIQRNQLQVDDAMVDAELHEQQLQFGTRTEHTGTLAYGDEITCRATVTLYDDTEPFVSLEECTLRVPSEKQHFVVGGIPLDEIGSQLRGTKTADELSFVIDFSEHFPSPPLRGKKAKVDFRNCSYRRISPADVSQVLEQYGTPNEAILRAQIKMSLQHNFDRQNTNFMMHQLYEYLLSTVDIPISKRIINKTFQEQCKQQLEATSSEELSEDQKNNLSVKAARTVKKMTINAWLQRTFKLGISEDDIDKQAAIIAEERRVRPSEIKEEYLSNNKVSVLGNMASERKIFQRLKERMVFTDV